MSRGLLFGVLWLIFFIVFGVLNWPVGRGSVATILLFVLLALLGWQVFGPIIQ